jgi:hypothetical protein
MVVDVTASASWIFSGLKEAEDCFKVREEKNHEVIIIQTAPEHGFSCVFNHIFEV